MDGVIGINTSCTISDRIWSVGKIKLYLLFDASTLHSSYLMCSVIENNVSWSCGTYKTSCNWI